MKNKSGEKRELLFVFLSTMFYLKLLESERTVKKRSTGG